MPLLIGFWTSSFSIGLRITFIFYSFHASTLLTISQKIPKYWNIQKLEFNWDTNWPMLIKGFNYLFFKFSIHRSENKGKLFGSAMNNYHLSFGQYFNIFERSLITTLIFMISETSPVIRLNNTVLVLRTVISFFKLFVYCKCKMFGDWWWIVK